MLVLSDGTDGGSKFGWSTTHYFAGSRGVALFGLMDVSDIPQRSFSVNPVPREFRELCESSGGIVMQSSDRGLAAQLQQFIALLRGRYILEFPAPRHLESGPHSVDVTLRRKRDAFVAVAGVSVAIPDPKLVSDPTTIRSQAGEDIPVGERRPDAPK